MCVFGDAYSKYYNLLYNDKDYYNEYIYIRDIIKKYRNEENIKEILDIGCGTGKHLLCFKKDGFNVSGVDASPDMLKEAQRVLNQTENIVCCKAADFKFNKKFDVIISLFHVMSYQTDTMELEKVFLNVSNHLTDNGIFIFDFWYGPAVLSDPPVVRIKRLEDNKIRITRIAEPVLNYNENIVDVNYEILVENRKTYFLERIIENHKMRYWFLPEIKHFGIRTGLSYIASHKWLDVISLSERTWYGLVLLGKCKKF
jgi:SAM-dependent methyltransferase